MRRGHARSLREAEGDEFARLFENAFHGKEVMAALAIDCRIRSGSQADSQTIATHGLMKAVFERLREGVEIAGETAKALEHLAAC